MKRKYTTKDYFKVYFKLTGYPFIWGLKVHPWWAWMMCKIGRHNFDLGWHGPNGTGLDCMDCGLYREITKNGVKDTYND